MRRGLLPLLICICSCATQNSIADRSGGRLSLDFRDCVPDSEMQLLELAPVEGYDLTKEMEHGFCEYRFSYKDGSIFYISTNTYSGSKLNYPNRLRDNIATYSVNRTENDTIKNSGIYERQHWLESINGSYVVGYVNAPDTLKFFNVIQSVELSNQ
ncbi:hypothetical protein [Ekhidna sp. To15]|uniref:hypothetical protein n=1 Tax=Ekhidna sp. To15 TaxID=3395267 RepID=UPI003F522BCF